MAYTLRRTRLVARSAPYHIVVIYFLVSLVWIILSDRVLAMIVGNGIEYVMLQTYKGWFFVAATSTMLYFLIKAYVDRLYRHAKEDFVQKQKWEAILKSIGEGVFVTDEKRRVIFVNKAMEKISGFKKSELFNKPFYETLHFMSEEDPKKELFHISDWIHEKGLPATPEEPGVLIRKDGRKVPVDGVGSPVKDQNGRIIGGVGVIRDVTAERERDQMKSDFVSLTSHQLRGPLTGIKWFVELMLENIKTMKRNEVIDYLEKINDSNQKLIELVNDLLNVSRLDSGKMEKTAKMKKWSLRALIKSGIQENNISINSRNVNVHGVADIDKNIFVKADKTQLSQVFSNLISNAIKFSKPNSEIDISIKRKRKRVVVCISDHGIGIPKKQKSKIFEKFFRAENAVETTSGTGLGLYIVRKLLNVHKGKIRIDSQENKGTKVYVELPIMYNENNE